MSLCATAPLYQQREFHQSALWRILVDHGENFLATYDSRYEQSHGPLPLQSEKVMEKLLRCGDPHYGLTLFHCPDCSSNWLPSKSPRGKGEGPTRNHHGRAIFRRRPEEPSWPFGFWDQPSLLSELRRALLKSLVARKCLQPETAKLLESWHPISPAGESSPRTPSGPLERSGFSAFVGSPINQPADRVRLERVLRYIFRPSLPLKHLAYVEATGEVRYAPQRAPAKVWLHAQDFLAYVTTVLCDTPVRCPRQAARARP